MAVPANNDNVCLFLIIDSVKSKDFHDINISNLLLGLSRNLYIPSDLRIYTFSYASNVKFIGQWDINFTEAVYSTDLGLVLVQRM